MDYKNSHLGNKVEYPSCYDARLLVRIPRSENRLQYDIYDDDNLFIGVDVWHAWEFGFLLDNGYPVTGVLKIVIPSDNKYIVESKSLKLYLNSFNMDRFGKSVDDGLEIVLSRITKDLSALLECEIKVSYFDIINSQQDDFSSFEKLEKGIKIEDIKFNDFVENPKLLDFINDEPQEFKIYSDVLRSNCKVTHQPDWGTVFIHMKSSRSLDKELLLKYLVSFRSENHFHEEVCEMIYKRLYDKLSPEILVVTCIYTRRGGIDISPVRANKKEYLPNNFINSELLCQKQYRQ